jgi:transposase
LELLEVVPADRNAASFKMLVGRLYNAGLSRRVLQETFRVDLKTIQRWAAALRSRDGEELVRVLAGRRAGRKLTPQIEHGGRILSRSQIYGIGKRLREEN